MATFQELLSEIEAPAKAKSAAEDARYRLEVARRGHEAIRDLYEKNRQGMTYLDAKQAAREVVAAEQEVAKLKRAATDTARALGCGPAQFTRLIESDFILTPFVAEAATDESGLSGGGESQEGTGIQGGAS